MNELPRAVHVANPASFTGRKEQEEIDDRTSYKGCSRTEFKTTNSQFLARRQLEQIKQTRSIAEYIAAFRRIMEELPKMHEDAIFAFTDGLLYETRKQVLYGDPSSLEAAYRYAERVNMILTSVRGRDLPVAPIAIARTSRPAETFKQNQATTMEMDLPCKLINGKVNSVMQRSNFSPRKDREAGPIECVSLLP
ncbi:hypothetical protein INT44_004905 [Umbelopsis vinacea]|uniref:Retrotransposon gag domain-containing protein n=1 Tax=Umbelopsis vinacea TaxID=44442 RepID=A0A8H7Q7F0_9FUNG|nr:hypothetical protein INT44_004905 [Umbelopsis vinacea]